jgi:coatomer subunit beta'
LWREDLAKTNSKAAQSLADPTEYENLFPELKQALQAEEFLRKERGSLLPAASFTSVPVSQLVSLPPSLSLFPHTGYVHYVLSSPQNSSERNVLEELAQGVSAMPVPSAVPEQDIEVAPPTGGEEKPQEKIDDVS